VGFAIFEFVCEQGVMHALGELALGELLLQASSVVRQAVRKADIIGRYGQAMLGVLLPYAGEHTPIIAQRVHEALLEWLETCFSGNLAHHFEVHYGYAYYPEDGQECEAIMTLAEQRLSIHRAEQERAA
jgi:GGDEF domain-containing protein